MSDDVDPEQSETVPDPGSFDHSPSRSGWSMAYDVLISAFGILAGVIGVLAFILVKILKTLLPFALMTIPIWVYHLKGYEEAVTAALMAVLALMIAITRLLNSRIPKQSP